jgi:hypothetical protein
MTTTRPVNVESWNYERNRLIQYIRDLLLNPLDSQARSVALSYLVEVFEDDGLENLKP